MNGDLTDKYPMTPPAVVAWLGYGGLLPFAFLTLAGLLDRDHGPLWSDALNAYGAIINAASGRGGGNGGWSGRGGGRWQ